VALIVCVHKLLGILNAIVKQQVFWKDSAALDISPLTPAGTGHTPNLWLYRIPYANVHDKHFGAMCQG
jgi:hypothetical protein